MKIATWNVNSVLARKDRLLAWLEKNGPDVLCLQELKLIEERFPLEEVRALGYHARVFGQKTYNGVAVLSRVEPERESRGLDDAVEDAQARLLEVRLGPLTVVTIYAPNGATVGSDKWAYKLAWLKRLRAYLDRRHRPGDPLVLLGDFNVAFDDLDVARPEVWAASVLYHPEARQALEQVRAFGLIDVVRKHNPGGRIYSWWDYRMLAFPKNDGLRIDHLLASESLAGRSTAAVIDRDERKGKQPSDHAPVLASFGP
jgi:exodeoxyribonuclease-3